MSSRDRIVKVDLPDGTAMYVEVEAPARGDIALNPKDLRVTWEDFKTQVSTVSKWVLESVKDGVPQTPAKVGVEFGLKLSAETGPLIAVLAKAGAEATVVIKMEWENSVSATPGP
jgi:hypothetical protein